MINFTELDCVNKSALRWLWIGELINDLRSLRLLVDPYTKRGKIECLISRTILTASFSTEWVQKASKDDKEANQQILQEFIEKTSTQTREKWAADEM